MKARDNIYTTVLGTLIELIESGRLPWRSLWSSGSKPKLMGRHTLPISISSNKHYTGINVLILWTAMLRNEWLSPYFGTFNAWTKLGCTIIKGSKAIKVVRWVEREREERKDQEVTIFEERFPVIHTVFNAAQVKGEAAEKYQGAPPTVADSPTTVALFPEVEKRLAKLKPRIQWGGIEASYNLRADLVRMPPPDRFKTAAGLNSVTLHEVGHWTGHPKAGRKNYFDNF